MPCARGSTACNSSPSGRRPTASTPGIIGSVPVLV
jgi:hypothetical protein